MTELEDWKRAVYEPEKAEFEATIRLLREDLKTARAERDGMREALKPFKDAYVKWNEFISDGVSKLRPDETPILVRLSDLRAAAMASEVLSALPQPTKEPT